MKSRYFALFTGLLLIAVIVLLPGMDAATQDAEAPPAEATRQGVFRDTEAETAIYTELNRWRMRRDRTPLVHNDQLHAIALEQARYMAQFIPFTEERVDFHADVWGDGVFRRAQLAGWPGYGLVDAVFVSEIAAYYPSIAGVIGFWRGSEIHSRSALNRGYREVGVAVLRNGNWLLAYAVLGSRPDVLPVTYMAATNTLIFSRDESGFSDALTFVPSRVRLLNAFGERLHDEEWLVWAERIPLPAGATDLLTVILSDGLTERAALVDLNTVNVLPADPIPQRTPTPTPFPTQTPPPPPPSVVPPTATLTPTPTVTPPPRDTTDGYDILLVYDNVALTLINQSGEALDMTPLVFSAQQTNTTITGRWLGFYSEVPLTAFPPQFCMQVWSFFINPERPPLPEACALLASGRSLLSAGDRFWLAVRFEVRYGGEVIATCAGEARECAFDIPR